MKTQNRVPQNGSTKAAPVQPSIPGTSADVQLNLSRHLMTGVLLEFEQTKNQVLAVIEILNTKNLQLAEMLFQAKIHDEGSAGAGYCVIADDAQKKLQKCFDDCWSAAFPKTEVAS